MSGSMLAPALETMSKDLGTNPEETQVFLSIFILAFAFGPMVLSPLAEVFGRRPVWILASCFYILWNTVAGFSKSSALLIASRVLSGLGASAEFAITNPVLSDLWRPEQRGTSFAISSFVPLLGPALGPMIGGVVSETMSWRWTFWVLSIFDGALVVIALFTFKETYEVVLLERRAAHMRKTTSRAYSTRHTNSSDRSSFGPILSKALSRPFRLLLTQPILQVVAVFLAYNFGILYIVLSTFAQMWIERYSQAEWQSGLHYFALVMGYTVAAQAGSLVMDKLWAYLKRKAGNDTAPEYRIPLMVPGAVLIPLGLLMYGWSAEKLYHWIIPDIGIAIFGCGIILNTQALQAYVMDAFHQYVASASAASQFLRSVAGFAFPIFAPAMYQRLSYGWGNTLLAVTFMVLGWPAPFLLWRYGATLRAKGKAQW